MLLSKAKLTLPLKRKDFFISSFQSCFVIGIIKESHYDIFLKFESFEFILFYENLRNIIAFLTDDDNNQLTQTVTLIKENKTKKYTWLRFFNNNQKYVSLVYENINIKQELHINEV